MNFIKQNIFYVVLVAITVVAGGVLIGMGYMVSDDIETKQIADRQQMLEKLNNFNSRQPTNQNVIDAKQTRQNDLKAQVDAVVLEGVKLNALKAMAYPDGKPVFPFNDASNKTHGYGLTVAYKNILQQKRLALRPTTQAGKEEIEAEAIEQAKLQKNREGDAGGITPAAGPAAPAPAPARAPVPGVPHLGMDVPGPGVVGPGSVSAGEQAVKDAANIVRLRKARMGAIYIPETALQNKFDKPKADTTAAELWAAQLALWAQSDILNAVNRTINPGDTKTQTVIASPIKLLEKIEVTTSYVIGGKTSGDATPHAAPGTGLMAPDPMDPGLMDPGMMRPGVVGPAAAPADASIAVPAGDAMGKRSCCKEFDVIRYSFVVVMSPRYLPALRNNLEKLNFHTILNVEQTAIRNDPAYANYYWGTDPVMKIKIDGEMILLTAWERGSWEVDKATGKKVVKNPPLMPLSVLEELKKAAPDSLREDDKLRTTEDGKPAPGMHP